MTPTRARLLAAGRRRQYVLLALGEPDDDWTLLHDRVGRDPGRARPARTVRSLRNDPVNAHFRERERLLREAPAGGRPVDRAAWERGRDLVAQMAARAPRMPLPSLGPVGDGSLDLWWHSASADLVVHCDDRGGSYYGSHRSSGAEVEGAELVADAVYAGLVTLGLAAAVHGTIVETQWTSA